MFFHDSSRKTRVTFKISNFYEELGFLTLGSTFTGEDVLPKKGLDINLKN